MNFTELRKEIFAYCTDTSYKNAERTLEKCIAELDAMYNENLTPYEMKTMQYEVILKNIEPVIFENSPFFYETGVVPGYSDGTRNYRGFKNAGGWTFWKNSHLFKEQDPELYDIVQSQKSELLYLSGGPYNDNAQHFQFNHRPLLEHGFAGVYEKAQKALDECKNDYEKAFLQAVCKACLCMKKLGEKFAEKASILAKEFPENANYALIAKSAAKCPWEKPESFYEALNLLAFMRKAIGSFEGIGPNSFGRVDLDLYPFYEEDIKSGRLTKDEAYELIAKFLITWDCHYDHDMKMVGYADHELENTYVLGGCDAEGNPVFNDLTRMFLEATENELIIFPKIKCRFSATSPVEYLDLINTPTSKGTSTILYCNDDALIPALIHFGRTVGEARDYIACGCWDVCTNCNDCGDAAGYMNLLKVFEFQIHNRIELMEKIHMHFSPIDGAKSFDEVYAITLENFRYFIAERTRLVTKGAQIWSKVDPLPLFSSTFNNCLENKKDFTDRGARYKDDNYMLVGFPNIVDSLLAIKTLCFDEKKYTLDEYLSAVRNNWLGKEDMRLEATLCHGWGDGSRETCELASKLHTDIYNFISGLEGVGGGKIRMSHMTYTEIRFWGEKTLATPDGRKNGDYFSQGLTPSRLKKIPNVTNVVNTMACLDKTQLAGNNVINIILPDNTPVAVCNAFLKACSQTAVESLQLNCVSKETLLDAQKHPEKYPDLIVRVCGFSAKFTSLTPEWQKEVISRNFYEG